VKRTFVLENGVHVGVRFDFGPGHVYDVMLADLSAGVLAHAACNGVGEALRDTGAGKSEMESIASFEKRLAVLLGGAYSARGGSRLDWIADIVEAVQELLTKAGKELTAEKEAELRAELEPIAKEGTAAFKKWLSVNDTRKKVGQMVDSNRKQRAAAAAKARTADIDVSDII
jgi:hypothetical protein